MKAYVCVYRHPKPKNSDLRITRQIADKSPMLRKFLIEYPKANCFFDWGDDPAFFSANELLGDSRYATWGVCRRDVRRNLTKDDLVIYFCAYESFIDANVWEYYFIGFGTVLETVTRVQIWLEDRYAVYREFFNVLAKLDNHRFDQYEFFGKGHDDWQLRAQAPYILFNPDVTDFNLTNPLHVATRHPGTLLEEWHSDKNQLVNDLELNLFVNLNIARRLRTKSKQFIHRHISLHQYVSNDHQVDAFRRLRDKLAHIVALSRN